MNELGNLNDPGTIIWSYTGICYETTLGWRRRLYGNKVRIAVRMGDGTFRWLRKEKSSVLTEKKMSGMNSTTDCRSEEGITVGLIDALISVARVLSRRYFASPAVVEALRDLADDEDINIIMDAAKRSKPEYPT